MTPIRPATLEDVPRLVAMGRRFLASSAYAGTIAENPAQMAACATALITAPDGVVLVAEGPGGLVGMLGLLIVSHALSGERVAGEVFWWVEPEARGDGLRLLRAAEAWACGRGATRIQMIAPRAVPAVGRVYARRGYAPIETLYSRTLAAPPAQDPAPDLESVAAVCRTRAAGAVPPLDSIPAPEAVVGLDAIRVHDDVLPADYRQWARLRSFGDVPIGPVTFHGIAPCTDDTLTRWIRAHYPHATPTLTFFRQSPAGQVEPNYIHTDRDMGDWTAILYLTEDPRPEDGTRFWRHTATGATASTATTPEAFRAEWRAWCDLTQWEPWHWVPAAPSRLLLFPAPCFHARAMAENYGVAGADARLIQLVFGTGTLEPLEQEAPVCV